MRQAVHDDKRAVLVRPRRARPSIIGGLAGFAGYSPSAWANGPGATSYEGDGSTEGVAQQATQKLSVAGEQGAAGGSLVGEALAGADGRAEGAAAGYPAGVAQQLHATIQTGDPTTSPAADVNAVAGGVAALERLSEADTTMLGNADGLAGMSMATGEGGMTAGVPTSTPGSVMGEGKGGTGPGGSLAPEPSLMAKLLGGLGAAGGSLAKAAAAVRELEPPVEEQPHRAPLPNLWRRGAPPIVPPGPAVVPTIAPPVFRALSQRIGLAGLYRDR